MRRSAGVTLFALSAMWAFAGGVGTVEANTVIKKHAHESTTSVDGTTTVDLPFAAEHVALHWPGADDADVAVAFAADGESFGVPVPAGRDEVGEQRGNGRTYGALLPAGGATAVRVTSDERINGLAVLALAEGERVTTHRRTFGNGAESAPKPMIRSRSAWAADESLRFRGKNEIWPRVFWPVQKTIVHHTATSNTYTDPASEIRAIYHYHAVTQGWGDVGYHFFVDRFGAVWEGRYSTGATDVTGENAAQQVVTAGHAYGHNTGTVGVAVLGTFTAGTPSDAASNALADVLAWEIDRHKLHLDHATYANPSNNTEDHDLPTVSGHRDANEGETECPGDAFYAALPALRSAVDARTTEVPDSARPTAPSLGAAPAAKGRGVALSWSASSDSGGSQLVGYKVKRAIEGQAGTEVRLGMTRGTSFADTTAAKNTRYVYWLDAFDGAGNVTVSNAAVISSR